MNTPPRRLVVPAPAKVNLFLHVVGRRDDGFHLIESLFALIDLADRVAIERRDDPAIVRENDVDGVAEHDDLAIRAARLLQRATGVRFGCVIRVEKSIPMGAGLGGGSSDAASVLLALNRLWSLALSRGELARLALSLGADVPFFVHGENAFVRGVGEVVQPVTLPRRWLALALPPVHVSTGSVFSAPELTRSAPSAKISVFSESYGHNDLAAVAASRHPEIASALSAWRARHPSTRMTGSGAGVIATCADATSAREAIAMLPAGTPGRVARTLERHPLARFA